MNLSALALTAVVGGTAMFQTTPHCPPPRPPAHHVVKGCEELDMEVKVKDAMPVTYQLNICGVGVPNQIVTCLRNSYKLPDQGEVMRNCTTQPYPKGYQHPTP